MNLIRLTLALLALSSCGATGASSHKVFDVAVNGDFGVAAYNYKGEGVGGHDNVYLSTTTSSDETYLSIGKTKMLFENVGAFGGLALGEGNLLGWEAGAHYFYLEQDVTLGLRYNELADAVLFSIGFSF